MLGSASSLADATPLPGCRVLRVRGVGLPRTAVFRYLGSYVGCDASLGVHLDISKRIGLAHGVFSQLRHLWPSRQLSRRTKAELLCTCVAPVLLFGSESWPLRASDARRLSSTWMSFVRRCLGVTNRDTWQAHTSQQQLLDTLGVPSLLTLAQRRLANWLGHVARLSPDRLPHAALIGTVADRRHDALGPAYLSRVRALLQQLPGVDDRMWTTVAQNRAQ